MRFAWSAEQEELRRSVRRFLDSRSDSRAVRVAMGAPDGFDTVVWERLARDLGLAALVVPESHGGTGGSWIDLAAVLEEAGRALLCAPLLSTVAMTVPVLAALAEADQAAGLLASVAAGSKRSALALDEPGGRGAPDLDRVATTFRRVDDGWLVEGRKAHVIDGGTCDVLLVVARAERSASDEGLAVLAVPTCTSNVYITPRGTIDLTRRRSDVELRRALVPSSALLAHGSDVAPRLRRALDIAAIALAAEQVGGATRCLDMAVEHAKTRVQFGRPVGSFQAVKHACADLHVRIESARAVVLAAACCAAGLADAVDDDALALAASTAKARASEAYFQAAAGSVQIHGGTGFTWEHDAHLHLKRARAGLSLLGHPDWHRARAARLLEIA